MNSLCINDLKRDLKSSIFIRLLFWPYMTVKKSVEFSKYQDSEDALKIRKYKNIHAGERCFIIGNGPSLKVQDLELLKNEITMAANRIYDIFPYTSWKPMYYFAQDSDGLKEIVPKIENIDIKNIFLSTDAKKYEQQKHENITHIYWTNKKYVINRYNDKSSHISEDVSSYFSIGYTVLFSAIQFAIYTGIKEIYLLGIDFNYSIIADKWGRRKRIDSVEDYFDKKKHYGSYLNYYSTLYAYQNAKKYCDEHEIKIYNATRGGKLEVFERVYFDSIFEGDFFDK